MGSSALPEYKRIHVIHNASHILVEGEEVVDVTVGVAEVKRNGLTKARRVTVLVTDRRVIIYDGVLTDDAFAAQKAKLLP